MSENKIDTKWDLRQQNKINKYTIFYHLTQKHLTLVTTTK